MNERLKFLDYFFVLRPTLFFPVWTVFLAGLHANAVFAPRPTLLAEANLPVQYRILVALLLSLLMGAIFIFNQIADIETDRQNNKLFFIANGIIRKSVAAAEGIVLTVVAIVGAFFHSYPLGAMFVTIFLICGVIYSFKPFSWKDRPILGIVANFGGGWSVAACGWIAAGATSWSFALHAVPYALGLVAVYLLTTLPDIDGDRAAGKITFGVQFGYRVTIYWALIFELATVVMSFWLKDYLLLVPAALAAPLFIVALIRQNLTAVLHAVKFTVLLASLAVCVKYPGYFLVIVVTFYFSKWYYRRRFNLEYPRFAA